MSYERAIDLSAFEPRRAEWQFFAAFAAEQLGRADDACRHLGEARILEAGAETAAAVSDAFMRLGCP